MKKIFLYTLITFLFLLGVGIDYYRYNLRVAAGVTGNPTQGFWFEILASVVFMAWVTIIAYLSFQLTIPLLTCFLFLFFGVLFTFLPVLLPPMSSAFVFIPFNLLQYMETLRVYTPLSGAFVLIISIYNVYRNLSKNT